MDANSRHKVSFKLTGDTITVVALIIGQLNMPKPYGFISTSCLKPARLHESNMTIIDTDTKDGNAHSRT